MSVVQDHRMPPGIPFIVVNEFAERFCYYGINSILAVYMTQFLLFTDGRATEWQHLFKSGAYFFPLLGAVVADVFWAKYRTIIVFSLIYCVGCAVLALWQGETALMLGLFLIAFGTGGIKPCVATNVGDQFTSKNQHLIERAFGYFYMSVNAGSLFSIYLCPVLLPAYGPKAAFGVPGLMMFVATLVFWAGRSRFAVVPPAGKAWLKDVLSAEGLSIIGRLAIVYFFVIFFWALWDQSNGTTWTLQAQSSLMDKNLGFGITLLPSQIQIVNAILILLLVPAFSYGIYPLMGRFFTVTPLRKIGIGLFTIASSFVIVAWIEDRIQAGHIVSVWWQILAYVVLTAAEVMVSITALEFSYKQAPLKMKSFIMAVYLLAISLGNLFTAEVNRAMVKPLPASTVEAGAQTWVQLADTGGMVTGQKINFEGDTGIQVVGADGKTRALNGTFLISRIDAPAHRVEIMDVIERKPVASQGTFKAQAEVTTYKLVGPIYFLFFSVLMTVVGIAFIFVAIAYREKTYVREDAPSVA
jgi:POT family proton-dependent oligopeptide transporter